MLDATQNYDEPLTLERLYQWHEYLFPKDDNYWLEKIKVGTLRGDEAMQVVPGPHNKRSLHFETPPRDGLDNELENFLAWLEESRGESSLDPLLRAGLAYFWFVILHPFDDGNGRLARVVSDYVLAQGERPSS